MTPIELIAVVVAVLFCFYAGVTAGRLRERSRRKRLQDGLASNREVRAAVNKAIFYLDPDVGVGPPDASAALSTLRSVRAAMEALA